MNALLPRISQPLLPRWVAWATSRLLLVSILLAIQARASHAQEAPGGYRSHHTEGSSVVIEGTRAGARVTFYRPDVVRVDWQRAGGAFDGAPDTSLAVIRRPAEKGPLVNVRETEDALFLRTRELTVVAGKRPLRLRFYDDAGRALIAAAPAGGFAARGDTAQVLRFAIGAETHFYGTGERGGGTLNLRGRAFRSYNTQRYGYVEAPATMKINVPLLVTSGGYALFFDSPYPGYFDIGKSQTNRLTYTAVNDRHPTGGSLTYFLIAGASPRAQLEAYTWLTGRQPLPPKWAFGYIQSKYGYRSAREARAVVDTLLQKNIPVSALVLDLYWFEHMGDLSWNREKWPHPMQFLEDMEELGVKVITITEPYITRRSELFEEAVRKGYVGERPGGGPYVMENWWSCGTKVAECDVALLDVTDPEARRWWWHQYPEFMKDGVDGFWTDLGEPERHPPEMQHALGSTARVHNVYNLLWAKTLFNGFHRWRPNRRIFNLTRSGFAGIQRYGTILWSGDVKRSFTALEAQIPLLLNVGLSGLGYYSSDLGGFTGDFYSPELYVRWLQLGAFTPTMRTHGVDNLPTEPWGFGPQALRIARRYIRLRYRMFPYNYALARRNYEHGTPLARPLFFADPSDPKLVDADDAYLWGEALLVAPVVEEGQREKELYLPRGTWINFWTGQVVEGGRRIVTEAPLKRIPVFAKAGSIIPMRASVRPTAAPFDTLHLAIFPHEEQTARFTLYEDNGQSLDYQRGAYAKTHLVQSWEEAPGPKRTLHLRIGPAVGTYDGLPEKRLWRADIRQIAEAPSKVLFDGQALARYDSRAALLAAKSGYYYDADAQRLVVQHSGTTECAHRLSAHGVRLAR